MQHRLVSGKRGHRQNGVALLTALVVLAIAATLAAGMIWSRDLDERRTASLLQGNVAQQYALGAEAWAEQILYRDAQQNKGKTCLDQDWAAQLPPLPIEGGQITGKLEDMQGRFNINNLASGGTGQSQQIYYNQFVNLLNELQLDPGIADAVTDWMTASNTPTKPLGVKDDYYSRLVPPYRTANQPMNSITELQLVKGVTPEVYAKLLPYVWALPPATAINVNTASPTVIQALDPHVTLGSSNPSGCFNSPPPWLAGVNVPDTGYDSAYFLLTAQVDVGTARLTMYSLLKRDANGFTHSIQRTLGTP